MTAHQRLPLTYDESRARFRRGCDARGLVWAAEPIAAPGPFGQTLTVDHVWIGAPEPRRALVLLSGVHGVEGFVTSAAQRELLDRLDPAGLPGDVGILVVHVVNPWGMAHDRRQNESNVDLNRNWGRDRGAPEHNDAYDEIHHLACPDTPDIPDVGVLLTETASVVEARGAEWVRNAITKGQFRHPDGLHFGGDRTEESTEVVERVVLPRLRTCEQAFVLDLHTGHGPWGEIVALSDRPEGSRQDAMLRDLFDAVEATASRPDGTSRVKAGPVARGIANDLPDVDCIVATVEVGTAGDLDQLAATYREQWVHRHGDLSDPAHRAVRWDYRCCFTPDDPEWEQQALAGLRRHVDAAVGCVVDGF